MNSGKVLGLSRILNAIAFILGYHGAYGLLMQNIARGRSRIFLVTFATVHFGASYF